jgi:hypothetical protein
MRVIVSILIGEEVIKIRIKQFRGKRYESTRHGSITEKLSGSDSVKNGWRIFSTKTNENYGNDKNFPLTEVNWRIFSIIAP